jgi:uncharacterized protein (TIGR03382 family)
MTIRISILFLLVSALLYAGPVLAFLPPGASIGGEPGQTVQWNFSVTNDVDFILVTEVDYLTLDPIGTFTDLFSPSAPVLGPSDWAVGAGQYLIDPLVPTGYTSTGSLEATYELYSVSPNDPDFNPYTDTLASGLTISRDASVTATPEPSTMWMAWAGAGLAALEVRRRIRA